MTAPSFFKNHAALSRVTNYDGSLNGAVGDVFNGTGGTAVEFSVSSLGNLIAFCFYDGAASAYKIVAGTISGTVITWGTPVTITDNDDHPFIKIISSNRLIIGYRDTEATKKFECKTYTVSGTTLTLDQTLNVANIFLSNHQISFAVVSATRVIAVYANTSQFATVIGLTVGAGVLTADAAANVIQSSAMATPSLTLDFLGSTKLIACYAVGTTMRASIITDGTTSTSAAASYAISSSSANANILTCCGAKTFLAAGYQSGSEIYAFRHTSGTIDSEFRQTGITTGLYTAAKGTGGAVNNGEIRGITLGDLDGDGIIWNAFAVGQWETTSNLYCLFIGFNGSEGSPEDSMRQVVKLLKSGINQVDNRVAKYAAIDAQTFAVFWVDDIDKNYKYMVVKL